MSNAIIYGPSGAGKTCNSTRVKGRKLLINTDGSHRVLQNFERTDLTIQVCKNWEEVTEAYKTAIECKKYDVIILDNLSDMIDMQLLEYESKYKDIRQVYQKVYTNIKQMTRDSVYANVDTIFTCWSDTEEITLDSGEKAVRIMPKIQAKIRDNVCGLMNIVALVQNGKDKDGNKVWYYACGGTETRMAKDQLFCREYIKNPENLFVKE